MMTRTLAIGVALASLAAAGAAFAQNPVYDKDGIPASSPYSPSTVNPMPDRDQIVDQKQKSGLSDAQTGPQAPVPINVDVAVRLGVPVQIVSNGPVPDTAENRARYGQPMSNAGRMTKPAGN